MQSAEPALQAPIVTRKPMGMAAVFTCAFLWFAALAWLRPLTMPDEGRYVGVALEMLRGGDWLVPRLDGLPFFHKPPLFYWLSAASMGLFGTSELAARLPSVLGASLAVAGLFMLVRKASGAGTAALAALVLAGMPYFYIGAQFANLDMLVAGVMSMTIATAAHATLRREAGESWRWLLTLAYVLAALGLLAKGLIGIVLPGAIYMIWALTRGSLRRSAPILLFWRGWAAFALVALPWFVAMQMRFDMFFDYFVVTQHFRRFSGSGFNNAQPFWFFVPVVLLLTLPWSAWLVAGARKAVRLTRWADLDSLMLAWLAVIIVFFSIPQSKLIGYVLPALPPLAYFAARVMLAAVEGAPRGAALMKWTAGASLLLCGAAALGLAAHERAGDDALLRGIAGQVGAADRVIMIDGYYYQVPFYWKNAAPAYVASDWRESVAASRDNWRKEMYDAGTFDRAKADRLLIGIDRAGQLAGCAGVTWVIGNPAVAKVSWLGGRKPFASNDNLAVWRLDSPVSAPGSACAMPSTAGWLAP